MNDMTSLSLHPLDLLRRITRIYTPVAWLCVAGVLVSVLIMLTFPLGSTLENSEIGLAFASVLAVIGLVAGVGIRYLFTKRAAEVAQKNQPWVVLWIFPFAIMVVLSPWLFTGGLTDQDVTTGMSFLLGFIIAYLALLLGFLSIPFVILPLELIGRGLISLFQGKRKQSGLLLGIGFYIALVTTFCVIGAFAIENPYPGKLGFGNIIFSLLGLPGSYTVENEALLWLIRAMAVVLIAVPIAFSRVRSQPTIEQLRRKP